MTPAIASIGLTEQIIRKSPAGMVCHFVKLDDDWGVKCFRRERKRNECYNWQKKAAAVGLGPKVGEMFSFGKYFCYITQVAEVYHNIESMDWDDYCDIERDNQDEIDKLKAELEEKIGFWFSDDHIGNIGFINGRMVCIDFGDSDGCG